MPVTVTVDEFILRLPLPETTRSPSTNAVLLVKLTPAALLIVSSWKRELVAPALVKKIV